MTASNGYANMISGNLKFLVVFLMFIWQGFWTGDSHAVMALVFFGLDSLRGLWHTQIQRCLIFQLPFPRVFFTVNSVM